MLTIRLARIGKKNKAQFQIVLQEHTVAPGGKHVEVLGSYDPHSKKEVLKAERIKYWVSQGAQVSDTAYNLFVSKGVLEGEKRKVKLPAKKVEEAKEVPAAVTEATEEVNPPAGGEVAEIPVVEEKKEEAPKEETPVDKIEASV
jgi:small subunit ribosomal protein S16